MFCSDGHKELDEFVRTLCGHGMSLSVLWSALTRRRCSCRRKYVQQPARLRCESLALRTAVVPVVEATRDVGEMIGGSSSLGGSCSRTARDGSSDGRR